MQTMSWFFLFKPIRFNSSHVSLFHNFSVKKGSRTWSLVSIFIIYNFRTSITFIDYSVIK